MTAVPSTKATTEQPVESSTKTKRLALFDLDGTLIDGSMWSSFFEHPKIGSQGKRMVYRRVLPVWLLSHLHMSGDASFRSRWMRVASRLLRDWPKGQTTELFNGIFDQLKSKIRPDVAALVKKHREQGDIVLLVSGMYQSLVDRFVTLIGASAGIGTELSFRGHRCVGEVDGVPCVGKHKVNLVRSYLAKNHVKAKLDDAYAYADSFSDVPLLAAVGHPVAVYPDRDLRRYAGVRHWPIMP